MSEIVLILVALVAGPVTVLITARLSKQKVGADVSKVYQEMSLALVKPQMRRIELLEKQAAEQDARISMQGDTIARQFDKIAGLERWAHALVAQVIESGNIPVLLEHYMRNGGIRKEE